MASQKLIPRSPRSGDPTTPALPAESTTSPKAGSFLTPKQRRLLVATPIQICANHASGKSWAGVHIRDTDGAVRGHRGAYDRDDSFINYPREEE